METNFENQLPELDELKQQYKVFNSKLDGQAIVHDENVTYIINHCRGYFQNRRRNVLIYYPLAMVLAGLLLAMLKAPAVYIVLAATVLLFGLVTELWLTKGLTDKSLGESSLAEFAQRAFEAKQLFLIYDIALICLLFVILFTVIITLDVPDSGIPIINTAILILCGLSVVVFLIRYLPVYRQCSKVIRSVEQDSKDFKSSNRGVKAFGIAIVVFILMTAIFKLLHLPCGTIVMLFTGLLTIIFAVVLAVRLHKRQGAPVIISLLLFVAMSQVVYFLMAWVNHWPPMRQNCKWVMEYRLRPQEDISAGGAFELWEVAELDKHVIDALQDALAQEGVNVSQDEESHAMASVPVSDTAKANAVILRFNADNSLGMPVFIWTNTDTCLEMSPLVWTNADRAGRCQLYALSGLPILSDMGQGNPLLRYAGLDYFDSVPARLRFNLTSEARKQWQVAMFGFGQRDKPVRLAAILHGHMIAVSKVDNDHIGYQSIEFALDPLTSIASSTLDELIKN